MDNCFENQISYAPLVLFVYNRADHAEKCLDAINQNRLANKTIFYVFSDGPKNENDREDVEKVRQVLKKFVESNNFKKVIITEATSNKGLANSVISGVSKVIKKYGKVIVLEDDLITSKDYINYMNKALDYYSDDKKIWSIAGFTPNLKCLKTYKNDVWFCDRAGSWGWATWEDRWDTIDWSVADYETFKNNAKRVKKFRDRGYNMPELLQKQMNGQIDSWAIRFCYEQFKQEKVTVNPTISRVYNAGFDGTGTHREIHKKWKVDLYEGNESIRFIPYMQNKKINKEYYYYQAQYPIVRILRSIWKNIKELFGIKKQLHIFD